MNKNSNQEAPACDQIEQIRVIFYVLSAGLLMGAIIVPLLMILLMLSS